MKEERERKRHRQRESNLSEHASIREQEDARTIVFQRGRCLLVAGDVVAGVCIPLQQLYCAMNLAPDTTDMKQATPGTSTLPLCH
mmetsp:Transcript_21473/g.59754  ORF Transcript_21473/g.59754 Transcript_21473/m.59754 type:complete len:85 (-) Transcript_21473:66-320(-)